MQISLVSPKIEDAWFWHLVRNQATTQKFNPMGVLDLEKLKVQISESNQDISAKKSVHRYFIQINDTNFAGVISIKDINWDSGVCELGYLIAEKFQGQGIATKAVKLILEKAFNQGNLRKVKATTVVSNVASYRVLQKNGFSLEGHHKDDFLINGLAQDVYSWGLLKENFRVSQKLYMWEQSSYFITTDKLLLQPKQIHRFLSQEAYWCLDIPLDIVEKAISSSLCFGVYEKNSKLQIGFARIVTDGATFAWVCDIYIEQAHRKKGLSKWLMDCVMNHPSLKNLRRICLTTKDAQTLYEKYGFQITKTPSYWMEIKDNEIYKNFS